MARRFQRLPELFCGLASGVYKWTLMILRFSLYSGGSETNYRNSRRVGGGGKGREPPPPAILD